MEIFKTCKAISYTILVPLFTYTGVSSELVAILSVLIILDIFTAIVREFVVGEKIKSRMFWVGVTAKMLLILIPFVVILVGKGVGIDLASLGKVTLSIFIVAEGYSIIGNVIQIRAKDKTIDEQDAITSVIKGIESMLKKILGLLMQKEQRELDMIERNKKL